MIERRDLLKLYAALVALVVVSIAVGYALRGEGDSAACVRPEELCDVSPGIYVKDAQGTERWVDTLCYRLGEAR